MNIFPRTIVPRALNVSFNFIIQVKQIEQRILITLRLACAHNYTSLFTTR